MGNYESKLIFTLMQLILNNIAVQRTSTVLANTKGLP